MLGMPRLIVDSTDRNSDLRYACAFKTTGDPVVFMLLKGSPWLVVPVMEREPARAVMEPLGGRVLAPADLALSPADRRSVGAWACALLRLAGVREVVVGGNFPVDVADKLRGRRIKVHIAAGPLFAERSVKQDRELAYCRKSQRAATAAMRAAAGLIREASIDESGRLRLGQRVLTSEMVKTRIEETLFGLGCSGEGTIVACGADSALPHHRGRGTLRAGLPIVIDIFPCHRHSGYYGDLTRTIVRGQSGPRLKEMLQAVREAHRAALAMVRAGVAASSVHHAAEKVFARRGMVTDLSLDPPRGFIHSTGHGVGLDVHEAPWLGRSRERLRAGQVVTVEPGWYEPGFGGVRIEDTVVVTRDGFCPLARCR